MKNGALRGIIQFILALAVVILLEMFYPTIIAKLKINATGSTKDIIYFVKYLIELIIVVVIYHGEVFTGKSRFNKSLLSSSIIALVTFIVMVVFTLILKKVLLTFNISDSSNFINYFAQTMTFERALVMIIECFIKPCLLCSIFVLGISNIISKEYAGMLIAGLAYGAFLMFLNHINFNSCLYLTIPVVNVIALTYLYKSTGNIYTCFITFILYNLCGGLLLSYIL